MPEARAGLDPAATLEALEAIRVETLGRKGKLAEVSKTFGKLEPEQRARVGKLLNAAKQELVSRSAKLAYPIRDGIPIMLPEEARKLD